MTENQISIFFKNENSKDKDQMTTNEMVGKKVTK